MTADNPPKISPPITVMTYNVGNGRARPERLVPILRACGADVIALQEVNHDQAQAIEAGLAQEYSYLSLHPGGFAGKALLSHYPIHSAELLDLGPVRPDLRVQLEVEGRR
jgi:endonuclease/exonuclease/phosphatase family metal-dependent hydrolase